MLFRLLVLALGTFAIGTDGFVIAGLLPGIAADLSVSIDVAGLIVAIFALSYALGSPIMATLTASLPRRRLLVVAIALFGVSNALVAVAPTFATLAAARVLAALAAATYTPTALAVAAGAVPQQHRGRALALVTGGLTAATVLGVPIGTLIGASFGWRMTFWLVTALSLLALAGILALLPRVARPAAVPIRERLAVLGRGQVLAVLAVTALWTSGAFAVFTYIAPLLEQRADVGSAELSLLLLGFGAASVAGNILGGAGADRWGAQRTASIGLALLAVALVALPLVGTSLVGAGLVLLLWGLAGWMVAAPQSYRLVSAAPTTPGVALSFNSSAIYLGVAVGASLGGLVLRLASVEWLGLVGGTLELGALAVLLVSQGVALLPFPRLAFVPVRSDRGRC